MSDLNAQVAQALALVASSNSNERAQALAFIEQTYQIEGFSQSLLQIAITPEYNQGKQIDICLQSAIQLKNFVETNWGKEMNVNDKAVLRGSIIDCISVVGDSKILSQLEAVFQEMVLIDYPQQWPELSLAIKAMLQSGVDDKIYKGLRIFKLAIKAVNDKHMDLSAPLFQLCQESFDDVRSFLDQLIQQEEQTEQTLKYLDIMTKIFLHANYHRVLQHFLTSQEGFQMFHHWMKLIQFIHQREIPQELTSLAINANDITAKESHIMWKIRITCQRISTRIFNMHAHPMSENKEFCVFFNDNIAESLLNTSYEVITKAGKEFLPSSYLALAIRFIIVAQNNPRYTEVINKNAEQILNEIILQTLLLNKIDIYQYEAQPDDYVRQQLNCKNKEDPRVAGIILLEQICKIQDPVNLNYPYLTHYVQSCLTYLQDNSQNSDIVIKEAIIYSLSKLSSRVKRAEDIRSSMSQILAQYVLPEIQTQPQNTVQKLTKARAFYCYSKYAGFIPIEQDHQNQVAASCYEGVMQNDLAVKVWSAVAMQKVIIQDIAKETLRPQLNQVLEQLLNILDYCEIEEIIYTLSEIIAHYGQDIIQYSNELCTKVATAYFKSKVSAVEGEALGDQDNENMLNAVQLTVTLRRLVEASSKNQQALDQMTPTLLEVIADCLKPDDDCFENALEIQSLVMFYQPQLSATFWNLFQVFINNCFITENNTQIISNALEQQLIIFLNYIGKDPQNFATLQIDGQTPLQTIINLIDTIMKTQSNEGNLEIQKITCCRLMIQMLECLKGSLGDALNYIVQTSLSEIQNAQTNLKLYLYQVLCMAFYNDAETTLAILEQNNLTGALLQNIFQQCSVRQCEQEIRRYVFGLVSLLLCPNLPQVVQTNYINIVKILIQLSEKSLKEFENRGKRSEEDLEEAEVEDENGNVFQDDDEDSDYDFDMDEEDGVGIDDYSAALKDQCEILYFQAQLQAICNSNPDLGQKILSDLTQEEQAVMQLSFQKAAQIESENSVVQQKQLNGLGQGFQSVQGIGLAQ